MYVDPFVTVVISPELVRQTQMDQRHFRALTNLVAEASAKEFGLPANDMVVLVTPAYAVLGTDIFIGLTYQTSSEGCAEMVFKDRLQRAIIDAVSQVLPPGISACIRVTALPLS